MAKEQDFDSAWDEMTSGSSAATTGKVDDTGAVVGDDADFGDGAQTAAAADQLPAGHDEVVDDAVAAANATQAQEDLWAGLSEAQRAALETIQNNLKSAEHRAAADSGRVSALQRKLDATNRHIGKTPVIATQAVDNGATGEDEDLRKFNEEFPDIAAPMQKLLAKQEQRLLSTVNRAVQPIHQHVVEQVADREAEQVIRSEDEVEKVHAGWKQTAASPAFNQWLQGQPAGIKAMGNSPLAEDAIAVLDLFTSATSEVADIAARRKTRLNQAVSVQGNQVAASPGRAQIPDDFDAAWDAYDAKASQSARR